MQSYIQTITSVSDKPILRYLKDAFQVIGGSLFLAFAAQIAIPLTPVELTMQTFAVMLLALTLGKVKGTLSVIAYIIESMMGFPVLSNASIAPLAIIGIKGGYLLGFVIQAYLCGSLFEKFSKLSYSILLVSLVLISSLQLSIGALWLGNFIGWNQALIVGFYPFIPGEIIKCIAVLGFAKK